MIVIPKSGQGPETLQKLQQRFLEKDAEAVPVNFGGRAFLVTSAKSPVSREDALAFPETDQIIDTGTEFQLSSRKFQAANTVIKLNDEIVFGTDKTIMMAGPCAVESEDQVMRTAEFLRTKHDVKVFRAGAFKPRTSPYTFQGMKGAGLRILEKVREQFGMFIVTEVKDESHLDEVATVADVIQIGTKSMYNFTLLERCGRLSRPILLKRGFMSTLKETLQAADFIISNGNSQVMVCERGIRTFEPSTRFCLDVCSAALLKEITHLPIVLDPSHAIGIAAQVPDVTRAAAALGVDGLLIEIHPKPAEAKSDREQALAFAEFSKMLKDIDGICRAVGRNLTAKPC